MRSLNYRHLLYFWKIAREGTVGAAAKELHLAQPTLSAQVRVLERRLGARLFERAGRRLQLTEIGRTVFRYADEIFSLGEEMLDDLEGRSSRTLEELRVGIVDSVPKLVAYEILRPALDFEQTRLIAEEGSAVNLISRLAMNDLDAVISDSPIGPDAHVKAFNHRLGDSSLMVFGTKDLARKYRRGFPQSLEGAPVLLPTESAVARRLIDRWAEAEGLRMRIVGEFEDSALLKVFAQSGAGLFFAPEIIEGDIRRQYEVTSVGKIDAIREAFYAISVERRVKHPGVLAIATTARTDLFHSDNGEAPE